MIKGDYFGKLLKPLFSILLIGFFGLLGSSFVNAGTVQMVGIEGYPSIYDTNYQLTFLKGGGLLTSFLGQGRPVIALNDGAFFWWATNGQPYYYDHTYQGFFGQYWLCDELTGYDNTPTNCNSYPITGDYWSLFSGFFHSVNIEDLVYYNYEGMDIGSSYYDNTIQMCWSSSEFGRTLCFMQHECYNGRGCSAGNYGSLVNSQNLTNLTYGLISDSWLGKAPGQNGYGGIYNGSTDGSVVVNPDNTYTGDYTYTECTFSNIYNQLNNMGYNPYLCYGGLDNYDNLVLTGIYNAQPGTGVNMLGIYTHSSHNSDKQSWFNYWNTSYTNQYVSSRDIWYNEPASLYFLFKFYNEYGGNNLEFLSVWEYCNIDWIVNNMSTMPDSKYTGSNFQYVCDIIKAKDIMNGIGGNDGENVEGLNWDGVGVLSGGKTYNDPGQFITDMFTKIKSYIPTDGSDVGLGFLPTYIITFMLFLMLFRFLSH